MTQPATAPFIRRVIALAIDWAIATVLVATFFRIPENATDAVVMQNSFVQSWFTLDAFAVLQIVAIWLFGASIGHGMTGLQIVSLNGKRAGFLRVTLRTLLLALVVPACVWDSNGRGMHDRAVKTAIVKR